MTPYQYFKLLAKIRLAVRGGATDLSPASLSVKFGVDEKIIAQALDKLEKEGIIEPVVQ
jgi:DNA-binding MarR family transcriptional regulator